MGFKLITFVFATCIVLNVQCSFPSRQLCGPNESYERCQCQRLCEELNRPCAAFFTPDCYSCQCQSGFARLRSPNGNGQCVAESQCPYVPQTTPPTSNGLCLTNEIYARCTCQTQCAALTKPCNQKFTSDCYSCQCAPGFARLTTPNDDGNCVQIQHCV